MNRSVAIFLALIIAGASSSNWHYGDESHWPEQCRTGKAQSPINLDQQVAALTSYEKFVFSNYNLEFAATIKNNGHSVQLNLVGNAPRPTVRGGGLPKEYTLDHLHFHWQSEHTLEGYRFPLEVHLVHYATIYNNLANALNYKDGVAVLGVFYDYSPDDDFEFEPLIKVMESVERDLNTVKSANVTRIRSFLPRDTAGFFRYNGSLTTPNCNEAVIWTVFTNTIPISRQQVKHFESVHSDVGVLKTNYRPLQDLHGRTLYLKVSPLPHGSAVSVYEKSLAFAVVFMIFLL